MKLIKLLANPGYGSRREVQRLIRSSAVTLLRGNSGLFRLLQFLRARPA